MSAFPLAVLVVALFFLGGMGLSYLISFKSTDKNGLILSPLILISVIMLFGEYTYTLPFIHGTDSFAWPFFLAISLFPLALILLFKKRVGFTKALYESYCNADSILALSLGLFVTLLIAIPSFSHLFLTSITLGNNDLQDYSIIARRLKEFPFNCQDGFICSAVRIHDQIEKGVFGTYYIQAFIASLLKLETYQTQLTTLYSFLILTFSYCFLFCKKTLGFSRLSSSILTLIIGMHPLYIYTTYHGFMAQIQSMSFFVPLIGIACGIPSEDNWKRMLFQVPLLTVLSWGLIISYPHMFPIIVALIGLIWLSEAAYKKSFRSFAGLAGLGLIIVTLCILLSTSRTLATIHYLRFINGAIAGWNMPWFSLDHIFGYFWPSGFSPIHTGRVITRLIRSLPYFIFVVWGFIYTFKRDKRLFTQATAVSAFILSGYIFTCLGREHGTYGGYKSFKWISYFIPILLPYLCLLIKDLTIKSLRTWPYFSRGAIALLLVIATGVSLQRWIRDAYHDHRFITPEMSDVSRLENLPEYSSINLHANPWEQGWMLNFLGKKELRFAANTSYHDGTSLDGKWSLYYKDQDTKVSFQNKLSERISVNSLFYLINEENKKNPSLEVNFTFGEGWHNPENGFRWSAMQTSNLVFTVAKPTVLSKVFFRYRFLKSGNQLEIWQNQIRIKVCESTTYCEIEKLVLNQGIEKLDLHTKLKPEVPSTSDSRPLGLQLFEIGGLIEHSSRRTPSDRLAKKTAMK